jgi:hypothetical protein
MSDPRMTVLARITCNLLDPTRQLVKIEMEKILKEEIVV